MLLLQDIIELGVTLLFEDWSLATHNAPFPWANVIQEGPRKEHQGRGNWLGFRPVEDSG